MKPWLTWVVGVGLVALAAWVGNSQLTSAQQEQAFVITAEQGEQAVARSFVVTITDIRAADALADSAGWRAGGNWLVVDLDAELRETEVGGILSLLQLQVGDRTYSASERPESLAGFSLSLGLPNSGSIAFELPEDVRAGAVTLRIGRSLEDRLDSIVEMPLDLGSLERLPETTVQETAWLP